MKLSISPSSLSDQKKDALIVFYRGSACALPPGHARLKKAIDAALNNSAFKGKVGQTTILPIGDTQVLLAGLGEAKHFHNALLEQAAAAAVRKGVAAGFKNFSIASTASIKGVSESDYQLLVGRGAAWGAYDFNTFKSEAQKAPALKLTFRGAVKSRQAVNAAQAQGESLVKTADLANLPGNEATPARIATWAKSMAREVGLTCQVMGEPELKKKGCGGILSVAQGSAQPPRMIILKHNHR